MLKIIFLVAIAANLFLLVSSTVSCGGDPNAKPGCGINCGRLCSNYNKGPVACAKICKADGCDCKEDFVYDEIQKKCVLPEDCCTESQPSSGGTSSSSNSSSQSLSSSSSSNTNSNSSSSASSASQSSSSSSSKNSTSGKSSSNSSSSSSSSSSSNGSSSKNSSSGKSSSNSSSSSSSSSNNSGSSSSGSSSSNSSSSSSSSSSSNNNQNNQCSNNNQTNVSCGGDENAQPGCGVNCNRHCSDIGKNPGACILVCYEDGCDCKPGYYFDDNIGKCVLPSQCTLPCRVNEVYSNCTNAGCGPKSCAETGIPIPCDQPDECIKGCACDTNYLRADNGTCIPRDQCPACGGDPNAQPGCGVNCGRLCSNYNSGPVACPLICNLNGCDCREGYVYDENVKKCVLPKDCSKTKKCTGPNEVYDDQARSCPPQTCDSIGINYLCAAEPESSKGACVCRKGYLRDANGKCIPSEDCPCNGDPNAVPGCGVNCGRLCSNYNKGPVACPAICRLNGCDCKKGYVYDSNLQRCVLPKDCTPVCGANEVFSNCTNGGCSARDCSQWGKPIPCVKLDPKACKKGCICDNGYLRADNGTCIPEDQCPRCLGQNEVYDSCPPVCPPQTCEAIGKAYSCPAIPVNPSAAPGYCKPACRCKPGFFRNLIDQCIPEEDCEKCTGPHEYFSCGGACDNVCATIKKQNQTNCPIINITCNRKCYCEEGYARDANNTCIPIDQCEDSCTSTTTEAPTGNDEDVQNRLVQGNIDFTGNFLYEVIKNNPLKSVVMSPFSVLIPLAELALYTEPGNSIDQLLKILNLKNKAEIRSVFPPLIRSLEAQQEAILDLAAKIYVNENFQLTQSFANDTRDVFGAEAENIDFSQPEQAADTINAWVEKETRQLIKDLVSPSMFSASTRLVLTNVIYFLGNWQKQFNPNDTKQNDFYVSNSKSVQVPLMYQKGSFKYAESEDLNCKIIEIVYKGGNFSYIAFLPNDVEGYSALAEKLTDPAVYSEALDLLKYETCYLYIPRHEIATSIDLVDILQKVSVTDIFDTSKADLSGILENNEQLGVSAAIQKANIKFDETGTEAAAANALVVGVTSVISQPTIYTFRADHPFIFYLSLQRNPLFCGVYAGN